MDFVSFGRPFMLFEHIFELFELTVWQWFEMVFWKILALYSIWMFYSQLSILNIIHYEINLRNIVFQNCLCIFILVLLCIIARFSALWNMCFVWLFWITLYRAHCLFCILLTKSSVKYECQDNVYDNATKTPKNKTYKRNLMFEKSYQHDCIWDSYLTF